MVASLSSRIKAVKYPVEARAFAINVCRGCVPEINNIFILGDLH